MWDDLGLEVLTDWKNPSKVVQLTIYLVGPAKLR